MAFLKTSYDDDKALLVGLYDFAIGLGWKSIYKNLDDAGYWQMGISKNDCHISIGHAVDGWSIKSLDDVSQKQYDDRINGGKVTDGRCVMALIPDPANMKNGLYAKNPGQRMDDWDYNTQQNISFNDFIGTFPNVWFFSNATGDYIHCVFQRGERYTSFSFGVVDTKGMTIPATAYCVGNYYSWWNGDDEWNYYSHNYYPNDIKSDYHKWFPNRTNIEIMIPDKILDPKFNWENQSLFVTNSLHRMLNVSAQKSFDYQDTQYYTLGILDFFNTLTNQTTTGGIPLHSFPVTYKEEDKCCWLGELPDIRLVNISNLSATQEITYGKDTWIVFPWKQKGLFENSKDGSAPLPITNTQHYGIAIKKII